MRKSQVYTAKGFARLLKRGMQSVYTPEGTRKNVGALMESLNDMGMARFMAAEEGRNEHGSCTTVQIQRAKQDSEWFGDLYDELEDLFAEELVPEKKKEEPEPKVDSQTMGWIGIIRKMGK